MCVQNKGTQNTYGAPLGFVSFLLESGILSAVVNGGDDLPDDQCQQTNSHNGSYEPKHDTWSKWSNADKSYIYVKTATTRSNQ